MAVNFHIYQKDRTKNYNTIDRIVKNFIDMGGVPVHCYPLVGFIGKNNEVYSIESLKIGDPVFNENSKRKYSRETFDLWGVTTMNKPNLAFGLNGWSLLDADEMTFSFHYNSMVQQLGRKIIIGDVLEMSFMRDLDVLGMPTGTNKFYTVTSSMRDEKGWAANYKYHLWKITCKPLPNSPEYSDLFNNGKENDFYENLNSANGGGGLDKSNTTLESELNIMDTNLAEAEEGVSFKRHDEHHIYLDMNDDPYDNNIFISQGIDGIAADSTCEQIKWGDFFPPTNEVKDGDYFLRIDYDPPILYKRVVDKEINSDTNEEYIAREFWQMREFDWREKWTGCPTKLRNIINNDNMIKLDDGEVQPMRQNIKDLVKAKVKKEHNNPRPWDKIGIRKP